MKNATLRILIACTIMLTVAGGALAHEEETAETIAAQQPKVRNWRLRFGFLIADTTGNTGVTVDPGSVDVTIGAGGGGFVSLERKVSPLIGIEFGFLGMGSDFNVSAGVGGKHHIGTNVDLLGISSMTLGVNFHFVDDGAIDVYAGPLVAFNRYADISIRTGIGDFDWPWEHDDWVSARTRTDSEATWGATAGIDIAIGKKKKRWSVGCSLTYLAATYSFERTSIEHSTSIPLNPIIFSFGGGFRF